jgi:N utilization substance protein B
MMTRHEVRENAFLLLFMLSFDSKLIKAEPSKVANPEITSVDEVIGDAANSDETLDTGNKVDVGEVVGAAVEEVTSVNGAGAAVGEVTSFDCETLDTGNKADNGEVTSVGEGVGTAAESGEIADKINYEDIELSEHIEVNDAVKELVNGVFEHKAEIDDIISKYSPKRKMSRIARINIVILELAIYESIYDEKTPVNSAISEAVKLIETYSYDENDKKFINGVLGSFSKATQTSDDIKPKSETSDGEPNE